MRALILAIAACLATAAHAAPPKTAKELYKLCRQYSPTCESYLAAVRDEVVANPDVYGKTCEGTGWTDANGNKVGTPASVLSNAYLAHSNQTWFATASAKDASVWLVIGMIGCGNGAMIYEPGDPKFPRMP